MSHLPIFVIVLFGIFGVGIVVMMTVEVMAAIRWRRRSRATQREYEMPRVAAYLEHLDGAIETVPGRVWADLDMDAVFQRIDRTMSWPGQHLLYARLRCENHTIDDLRWIDAAADAVAADAGLRETIRARLRPLDDGRASLLPELFQRPLGDPPALARLCPIISAAAVGVIVVAFWWPPIALALVAIALMNAFIRAGLRHRIDQVVPAVRLLPAMLKASQGLATLGTPGLAAHASALRESQPELAWIGRVARWLAFEPVAASELAGYVYEYVNLVFLLDVTAYVWALGAIRGRKAAIARAYAALGELDVAQALATLRLETPSWTRPEFVPTGERILAFETLVHPLLEEPVGNSLDMRGQAMLLTGSNMSGKSTFIRAVGVNALLAQSLFTVFATAWRAPRVVVRTSIGRADSLLEGKSYYRAEVDVIGALLGRERGAGSPPRLVLIDELFRGTNSIERVAAAKSVLQELDRREDLVIVATHDVELLELLPAYAAYHFREDVREGQLTFDYRLRPGACSTRNALAILALAGYPPEVVAHARETANVLEERVNPRRV